MASSYNITSSRGVQSIHYAGGEVKGNVRTSRASVDLIGKAVSPSSGASDRRSLSGLSGVSGISGLSSVSTISAESTLHTWTAIFDYDPVHEDELRLQRGGQVAYLSTCIL